MEYTRGISTERFPLKTAAVLVLFLSSLLAFAQAPATTAQPATRDDIAHLLEVMDMKKQVTEMQRTMLDQYKPMLQKMGEEQLKGLSAQQRQKFNDIMAEFLADSFKSYPPEDMIADLIPIYQKYLDKSDVQVMSAFYASPTGRKFLDNQPKIVGEYMSVIIPNIQTRMQAPLQKLQERMRELVSEGQAAPKEEDFKPAKPTPAPK